MVLDSGWLHGWKSALTSKTIWSGIVAILAGLAGLLGYGLSQEEQRQLIELLVAVTSGLAGIGAIFGRVVARRRIGRPVK